MFSNDPSCPALMLSDEGSGISELTTLRFAVELQQNRAPFGTTCPSALFIPLTASEYSKKIKVFRNTLSFAAQSPPLDMPRCSSTRRAVSSPVHEGLVMAQKCSPHPALVK
ncbi:hypothetical protein CDAR_425901 [Caerostris darwini]|uniref:Uncharacterized protein n=1 Tax=Caerostris darwini TaxID=1538125 RepID=A0AAV4WMI1_9ARAC|nr:hypothetical protein CDAR_425901 [Caerostris darwini]